MLVPSLGEIGSVDLEKKIFKFRQCILSSPEPLDQFQPNLASSYVKFAWNWFSVSGEEDENVKSLRERRRRTTYKYWSEKFMMKSEMFMKIYWMNDIKKNFDKILSEITFAYGVIRMWVLNILRRGGCENAKGYKANSAPHLINEDRCSYPDLRIALIIGHCILWSSIFCPKHRAVNAVI